MKNLVVLVPSRGRPDSIKELVKAFDETKTESDLLVICDHDDSTLSQYLETNANIFVVRKEGRGMAKPLNFTANLLTDNYRHFAFLGDDHRPRTEHWDVHLLNTLDELGTGLAYGNDLLQGEQLPTAIAMTGDIVKALGGMTPQGFIHLYLDNFWLQLGRDLNAIRYLPDVIIEHLHPVAGKAEWDEGYKAVNSQETYSADAKAFNDYITSKEYADLVLWLTEHAR